jgi:hypothetical protein
MRTSGPGNWNLLRRFEDCAAFAPIRNLSKQKRSELERRIAAAKTFEDLGKLDRQAIEEAERTRERVGE